MNADTPDTKVIPATDDDVAPEIVSGDDVAEAEAATEADEVAELDLSTGDGIAMALASFGDASVIEADLPTVVAIEAEIHKSAGTLANFAGKLLKVRKDLARFAVRLMPHVKLPSGLPDWDGTSKGFKVLFDDVIDAALAGIGSTPQDRLGKQERKNLLNSIRGHVRRTYLEPAIRAYVYDTSTAVQESMPGGRKKDGTYADSDSELFKHLVKNEYLRCSLTPPNRYLSPEEVAAKRSEAGPGDAPVDPAQTLRRSVEGAEKMGPQFHAAMALQLVSSLAQRITDQKNPPTFGQEGRALTSEYASRISNIALYVARFIDAPDTVADPVTDGTADDYWTEADSDRLA